jgi:hypothetical protein
MYDRKINCISLVLIPRPYFALCPYSTNKENNPKSIMQGISRVILNRLTHASQHHRPLFKNIINRRKYSETVTNTNLERISRNRLHTRYRLLTRYRSFISIHAKPTMFCAPLQMPVSEAGPAAGGSAARNNTNASSHATNDGQNNAESTTSLQNPPLILTDPIFVHRSPKIENHVHLDGAWDIELLLKYCKKYVDDLPETVTEPMSQKKIHLRQIVRGIHSVEDLKPHVRENYHTYWICNILLS